MRGRRLFTESCEDSRKFWDCSAQRREGSRENLVAAFLYLKGAYKKDEDKFLTGSVPTGQGAMVLN